MEQKVKKEHPLNTNRMKGNGGEGYYSRYLLKSRIRERGVRTYKTKNLQVAAASWTLGTLSCARTRQSNSIATAKSPHVNFKYQAEEPFRVLNP